MLNDAKICSYFPASDVPRARKFYEEIFGLVPKVKFAGGVIYECGGSTVFLYPTLNAGASKASHAFWQVTDVEAEVKELKSRGVTFEEYACPASPWRTASRPEAVRRPPGLRTLKAIFWRSAKPSEELFSIGSL